MRRPPLRLLVGDDDAVARARVRRDFARRRIDVSFVEVSTLDGARRALEGSSSFDCAVLDLRLPDGDSSELLGEAAAATPIVILTSDEDDDLARRLVRSGAQECLAKTSEGAAVVRAVRHAIERHRARSVGTDSRIRSLGPSPETVTVDELARVLRDEVRRLGSGDDRVVGWVEVEVGPGAEGLAVGDETRFRSRGRAVGRALGEVLRAGDRLARLGEGRFVVLVGPVGPDRIEVIAERIRGVLECEPGVRPLRVEGRRAVCLADVPESERSLGRCESVSASQQC